MVDFSLITPILLVIIAFAALIGAAKGYKSGIARQAIRFGTLVLSIVLGCVITTYGSGALLSLVDAEHMQNAYDYLKEKFPEMVEDLEWVTTVDPASVRLLLAVPLGLIVAPIAFVICFIVLYALTKIIHVIICKICGFKKTNNNFLTRMLGMVLGAVQGVVIFAMLMLPILGLGNMLAETASVLAENAEEEEASAEFITIYEENIQPITENQVVQTLGKTGVNFVFKKVTTVYVNETYATVNSIVPDVTRIYFGIDKLDGCDWASLTPEQKESINFVVDVLSSNEYLTALSAETLHALSSAYRGGAIPIKADDERIQQVINEIFIIFDGVQANTVKEDVHTLLDAFYILSDDGVVKQMLEENAQGADVLEALNAQDENGVTVIDKVVAKLNENQRTRQLVTLLVKVTVSALAGELKGEQPDDVEIDINQTYNDTKDSLNDVLKIDKESMEKEEYITEASNVIDSALREQNIEIEKEIIDKMAEQIYEDQSGKFPTLKEDEELTEEQMNNIILTYYDAYLKYQDMLNSGELDENFTPTLP